MWFCFYILYLIIIIVYHVVLQFWFLDTLASRQAHIRILDNNMGMEPICLFGLNPICSDCFQLAMDHNLQLALEVWSSERFNVYNGNNAIMFWCDIKFTYLPLLSLATTHVDLPQNGVRSHDLPGSTVAHRVDAKHIPGKSIQNRKIKWQLVVFHLAVINIHSIINLNKHI